MTQRLARFTPDWEVWVLTLGGVIILRDLTSLVGNNSYSASFGSGVHTGIGYCQGNLNLMLKMIKNYLP